MPSKEPQLPPELANRIESLTMLQKQYQGGSASISNGGNKTDNILSLIQEWKEVGNQCFKNERYFSAIRCYTNGLQLSEADAEQCAIFFCNRSAAYLKSVMCAGPSMAMKDAEKVIELRPNWFKGYLRLADAHYLRRNYEEAEKTYRRVLELEPACAIARASLGSLRYQIESRGMEKRTQPNPMWSSYEKGKGTYMGKPSSNTGRAFSECFPKSSSFPFSTNSSTPAPSMKYESSFSIHSNNTTEGDALALASDSDCTENLVRLWKKDLILRDDRTAMKPRAVSFKDVDSSAGRMYKEQLLSSFRSKMAEDTKYSSDIYARIENQHLKGQNVNYREADKYRNIYERSTNGIGLAITADAYKEFNGLREGYY
ncbi:unnamed protein product [Phytomonas sp. Hart1]|nr:unnamed protein product [Phytomonas sp. Hart1]|eukprot:CCW66958.1 unnamed protein product [Phytomonas sp. isolate Hart1]